MNKKIEQAELFILEQTKTTDAGDPKLKEKTLKRSAGPAASVGSEKKNLHFRSRTFHQRWKRR